MVPSYCLGAEGTRADEAVGMTTARDKTNGMTELASQQTTRLTVLVSSLYLR